MTLDLMHFEAVAISGKPKLLPRDLQKSQCQCPRQETPPPDDRQRNQGLVATAMTANAPVKMHPPRLSWTQTV